MGPFTADVEFRFDSGFCPRECLDRKKPAKSGLELTLSVGGLGAGGVPDRHVRTVLGFSLLS